MTARNRPRKKEVVFIEKEIIWKGIGALGLIIGIVITLTPFNLAHVCSGMQGAMGEMSNPMSAMATPMKCNFMGTSEVFLGLLVAFIGLLLLLTKNGQRNLSSVLGVLGLIVILMPTSIGIGICAKAGMACHTTQVFLTISGIALIAVSLVGLLVKQSRS